MVAAYAVGDYMINEIAAHFNAHYSTVSREVKQMDGGALIQDPIQ